MQELISKRIKTEKTNQIMEKKLKGEGPKSGLSPIDLNRGPFSAFWKIQYHFICNSFLLKRLTCFCRQ